MFTKSASLSFAGSALEGPQRRKSELGILLPMFERFKKFKKPCCLEFYNAYDTILKNHEFHEQFFSSLKKKLDNIKSTEQAHKDVIDWFIDFICLEILDPNKTIPEEAKRRTSLCQRIFNFCCDGFFEDSTTSSDLRELKNKLFKSEIKCLKLFDNVQHCLHSKDFSTDDKKLLQYLIDEFKFIRTFSSFISQYKKIESIDLFKRFFFIYPFERKDNPSERNKEWLDNHNLKFEIVKNYINSSQGEYPNACEWFKKQLDKVEFAELSEENKSIFFKEMFVTFGNFSNKKTGDAKGFRVPLNNLFYLGRYYNVHLFPLRYEKEINDRHMLETIARETWRRVCKFKLTSKDELEKAKGNPSGKMSQPNEIALYSKKAPRDDIERLKKQHSQAVPLKPGDDPGTVRDKIISSLDVSKISNAKKTEEILVILDEASNSLGMKNEVIKQIPNLANLEFPKEISKEDIPELIVEKFDSLREKGLISANYRESIKNIDSVQIDNFLKMIGDSILSLSPALSIRKAGVGLQTHFDMYKVQKFLQEIGEKLKITIQKFA